MSERFVRRIRRLIHVGALCAVLAPSASGQVPDGERYTLVLQGVPLSEALELLAGTTGIELVYPSRHVAGKRVYCNGRSLEPEALLRCILTGSRLDYVRSSSGAYILIESVAEPSRYGGVAGTVVDGVTGAPLARANVLLAEAQTGTTTNEAGLFTMPSLVSGPYRVVVTYVGYRPGVDSVWVRPGATQRLRVALQPEEVVMKPLVISGLTQRLPSQGLGAGLLRPGAAEARDWEGAADVIRGAVWIPGVTIQQPFADLHIQGGATGEHATLLDGVPVRDPVSLGRYLSAFSPLAIGRVTVHKAGFGADRGSHLSGVVEVEHDVAFTDDEHLAVSVDPVSLNGRLGGRLRFPGTSSATFMAAARTSVWGLYRDAGISDLLRSWNAVDPLLASVWTGEPLTTLPLRSVRNEPTVAFSDVHAATRLQLTPFQSLYVSAYRAHNELSSELAATAGENPPETSRLILTRDGYAWTNWVGQARYALLLGARSTLIVQAQGSWNESLASYFMAEGEVAPSIPGAGHSVVVYEAAAGPASHEENHIRELALKADLSHSVSPGHRVGVGLGATHVQSDLLLGNPFVAPFMHSADAWHLAGSATGQLALGLGAAVEPGLRLTYLPERRHLYAEPRLAVRYDGMGSPVGAYALRLAGGLYRQFINRYSLTSAGATSLVPATLLWLPTDASTAPPMAYHLSADALLVPGKTWTVSLDAYYKWQPRLLTLDYVTLVERDTAGEGGGSPEVLRQSEFVVAGRGRAYGVGVRALREGDRLTWAVSYRFSQAEHRVPGRFYEGSAPPPWNEPHVLQVNADVQISPAFEVGADWRSVWGRTWGLRRAYYDYIAHREYDGLFADLDLSDPSDSVLPPLHQLDVGGSYLMSLGRARVRARLSVAGVLDRRNVYDWSFGTDDGSASRVGRLLPGRHLTFGLRLDY